MEKSYLKREKNSKKTKKKMSSDKTLKKQKHAIKDKIAIISIYMMVTPRVVVQLLEFCLNFDFFFLHHAEFGKFPKYFKNYSNCSEKLKTKILQGSAFALLS